MESTYICGIRLHLRNPEQLPIFARWSKRIRNRICNKYIYCGITSLINPGCLIHITLKKTTVSSISYKFKFSPMPPVIWFERQFSLESLSFVAFLVTTTIDKVQQISCATSSTTQEKSIYDSADWYRGHKHRYTHLSVLMTFVNSALNQKDLRLSVWKNVPFWNQCNSIIFWRF